MSFEEFAIAEADGLLRYATALSGDPDRAADVVQDALIRAGARWDRIRVMDFPLAYVRRMITNAWLNSRRSWWARNASLVPHEQLLEPRAPRDDFATDHAERAAIEAALAVLPRRQYIALVLRYYLGYDDATIAQELGCAIGTVRSLCSRGTAALRAHLSQPSAAAHSSRTATHSPPVLAISLGGTR